MSEVLKAIVNDLKESCKYQIAADGFTRLMITENTSAILNHHTQVQFKKGSVHDIANNVACLLVEKNAARKVLKTENVTVEDL